MCARGVLETTKMKNRRSTPLICVPCIYKRARDHFQIDDIQLKWNKWEKNGWPDGGTSISVSLVLLSLNTNSYLFVGRVQNLYRNTSRQLSSPFSDDIIDGEEEEVATHINHTTRRDKWYTKDNVRAICASIDDHNIQAERTAMAERWWCLALALSQFNMPIANGFGIRFKWIGGQFVGDCVCKPVSAIGMDLFCLFVVCSVCPFGRRVPWNVCGSRPQHRIQLGQFHRKYVSICITRAVRYHSVISSSSLTEATTEYSPTVGSTASSVSRLACDQIPIRFRRHNRTHAVSILLNIYFIRNVMI